MDKNNVWITTQDSSVRESHYNPAMRAIQLHDVFKNIDLYPKLPAQFRYNLRWAKLLGVNLTPEQEYCSTLKDSDRLPRGVKKGISALKERTLRAILKT